MIAADRRHLTLRTLRPFEAAEHCLRECSGMSPERISAESAALCPKYDPSTLLAHIDENWLDILTGHAAARFTYLDVRDSAEFERLPPRWKTLHIPLDQLRTRSRELPSASVVVYGSTDEETEAAAAILKGLRIGEVRAFVGGFDALQIAGLR
jgi:rhodanese-related sulfurtransferase